MFFKNSSLFQISILDLSLILFLITLVKILFFFTGFILEDSFIVFRSAFHLADYGIFSYNLDEINSGTTSKIFGLICAFFRKIFNDYAILSIIFFNSIISFLSSLLILLSLKNLFGTQILTTRENLYFLVIFIFINPSISLIGIVGLEFSIMVFFISLVLLGVSKDYKFLLISSMFIPFIRIEMIGFILILSFSYLYFLNFKSSFIVLISGLLGVFFNGYLNKQYDGTFFPGPAVSKWNTLSNEGAFTFERIINDINFWFFSAERSFFLGVYSKFIPKIVYVSFALIILSIVFYHFRFLLFNKYKEIKKNNKIYLLTISSSIILLPLSYVVGGHVWEWYLYPYSFLSYVLLTIFLINLEKINRYKIILMSIIAFITLFQFAVLKNIGFQENSYRSVVGKDIYSMSEDKKNDTLFLEPSGYIPYYAKIKTYDTVGLSSPEIHKYRKMYKNKRWWLDFIEDKKPTFILDRSDIYGGYSHDGEYTLNASELKWFKQNYIKVKEYNYHKYVEKYSGSFEAFYKLGNHAPYFLYKEIKK